MKTLLYSLFPKEVHWYNLIWIILITVPNIGVGQLTDSTSIGPPVNARFFAAYEAIELPYRLDTVQLDSTTRLVRVVDSSQMDYQAGVYFELAQAADSAFIHGIHLKIGTALDQGDVYEGFMPFDNPALIHAGQTYTRVDHQLIAKFCTLNYTQINTTIYISLQLEHFTGLLSSPVQLTYQL